MKIGLIFSLSLANILFVGNVYAGDLPGCLPPRPSHQDATGTARTLPNPPTRDPAASPRPAEPAPSTTRAPEVSEPAASAPSVNAPTGLLVFAQEELPRIGTVYVAYDPVSKMVIVQDGYMQTIFNGILAPGEGGLLLGINLIINTGVTLQELGTPENPVYNFTLIINGTAYPNIFGEIEQN